MPSMKYSHLLAPVMCAVIMPSGSVSQNQASFNILTSNAAPYNSGNTYAVDVNNDGLTDIVQDGGYSPSAFFVSINNGNGTFAAPVEYPLPLYTGEPNCIAAADYNNDGKIDLAVPLEDTNEIAVYLGNGDGTFQTSPIISTINLPSGFTFAVAGCAAADFNADGDIDFAAWTTNNSSGNNSNPASVLYVFQGLGNGSFDTSPYSVLAGPPLGLDMQVFVGDYNGDGKADIAANAPYFGGTTSTMNVLYGNNDFTFNQTTLYTFTGYMLAGSGDLNSDGITDLYVLTNNSDGTHQIGEFYGTNSGTFNSYWYDVPTTYNLGGGPAAWPWQPSLTMGDYNGDGRMDLAAVAYNSSNSSNDYMEFFLAGANPGEFTTQVVAVPVTPSWFTFPVAGLFSGGYLRPDVTFDMGNSGSDSTTPTTLSALLNTTNGYFGFCTYPKNGKGINICVPGLSKGNIAVFTATADSFGKLRKIELWVDGTKVQEQAHTWDTHAYFDWAGTFSNGPHKATFYAYDIDNTVQRSDFTFEVDVRH
ncbi:MAG: VCBS repeat-containing protein [Terracidiphilus sp.]|jgi:hypothetical protein